MKRLMFETSQLFGTRTMSRDITDEYQPWSRVGQFFWPSGSKEEFGQIVELRLTYSDGHIRTYRVEEVEDE